jgi:serine phosphatase RsbU (regulator of sigma subunit)
MEKEMQQASEIQRKLLPVGTPSFTGYDLTGFNDPCREVGGDYFDFIDRGAARLGFAIGDVSGKGMGAALLMATVRASFRAHLETPCTLESLASSLNNTILQSAHSNNFVSFFYGELDGPSGRLHYVNAGHNPPILVRAGGEVHRLKASGLILGVFPGARHTASETSLEPGDMLVAYSDGVTETQNPAGDEYGEERLIELLMASRGEPAAAIQERVAASIKAFAGTEPQYDDVTLMVLKRA